MDFAALVGRAARYSPDAMIITEHASGNIGSLNILYANKAFCDEVGCDLEETSMCQCNIELGPIDFTQQAILIVNNKCNIPTTYRVSVTQLPKEETDGRDCLLLCGRPSSSSLAEGREKLYGDIARKFIELPADEAAQACVRSVGLFFGAQRCYAARVDLDTCQIESRYYWDKSNNPCDPSLADKKVCSWVLERLRQGEVIQVRDRNTLPKDANDFKQALTTMGAKSALKAPVLLARGSLWFVSVHVDDHIRDWTEQDVSIFRIVGDLFGNAFTQTETVWSLKETQRRFSDVGANIPGVVYQMRRTPSGDLHFSYISQGVRELTGWGPASMMSDPTLLENLVLREDRGRFRETLERAGTACTEWSIDIRIQHRKTEEIMWVRASGRAHNGVNGDMVWNGLLLDISEHRKAEEAVRVSEERLRRILGTSPISIGISDVKSFKLLFANKRLAEMYQIPKHEVIGYDTRKFYADKRLHRRHWVETRREKSLSSTETPCVRTNGEEFWAEITTRLIEYGGREAILWWSFDISEHKRTKEALAHLAHHDALTGLANRRLFDEHLQSAVALAARTDRPGVLFYFDLDGFKAVNDQFGHSFGDWVLDQVGDRLRLVLRDSDIGARLGGDEFAVVAHGIDDLSAIEAVITKLQNAISAPYVKNSTIAKIGLSIGVVRFYGKEKDIHKIVKLADSAMYEAKQAGKGTHRIVQMPSNDSHKAIS
ncbi:MAG: diguanylate cyclase [Methylocystaceae bacterium]|nr:diguanylate cyclase [Methylocystaceae bacterium]